MTEGHYRRVEGILEELRERMRRGYMRPGDRFLSNRGLARRYSVSYQTAHRILARLCEEGWLERRHGSGTRVAGDPAIPDRVICVFHPRARREGDARS